MSKLVVRRVTKCWSMSIARSNHKHTAFMKTRKRTISTANSSHVSATGYSSTHWWLRQNGFVRASVADHTAETLAVAVKAFQAQLEVCSKQPPQQRHAGFTQHARKQRLEFRAGDGALGQLGLLQSIATTVVQTLGDIARENLQGLEKTLQLPAGAFLPFLESTAVDSGKQSSCSLEAIHYKLPEGAGSGSLPACESHEDKGLLTVIYADTYTGLQVQGPDGTWRELPLSQSRVAVLAGYTLERATCGLIKAAKHRVAVAAPGGCPTARTALVYKLRAPDTAVLGLYAALSKHYQHAISPRYHSSIGVCELMHFFDATHVSVNALPASAPNNEQHPVSISTKKAKKEPQGLQLKLLVFVESQDGSSQGFLLASTSPLQELFHAFCLQRGVSMSDSVFLSEGNRLDGRMTAEQYDLEPEDVIDHVSVQTGD